MAEVVARLRRYVLGWKGYFGLAQHPSLWRQLDGRIRRRLRAVQLKQWRRGKMIYRELYRLGADPRVVRSVACTRRRWWHYSRSAAHDVLTIAYFDRLGVPPFILTSTSRTARCGPARLPSGVAGARPPRSPPFPDFVDLNQP